jgi:dolichol-phosphate mannosyltransferase
MKNNISIIVSLYNEEPGVLTFWNSLKQVLLKIKDINFEVIWVNDGSYDNTQTIIDQVAHKSSTKNIIHHSIEFSKNFGHEAAMIAGIDNAKGEAVICLDADGQHPPSEIPNMIALFHNNYDIVLMKRIQREDNSLIKKAISSLFYQIINTLSSIKFQNDSSDFFLISQQVTKVLKSNYREHNRFIRGFIQSIGFSLTILPFYAPARIHGESNYSYKKLFKLALDAIFTFSFKPLRISIFFSVIFIFFTFILSIYSLYIYIYGNTPPSGYTTLVIFLSFSFSLLFSTLTILSLYFEKTIQEMRQRPIYIIKKKTINSKKSNDKT